MDQEFKNMCELWKQTQKESKIKKILEENQKKAQQTIKHFTYKFKYDSSKIADLIWKNTFRSDWVNIIYQEHFDGLDVLDMTMDDVMSLPCFQSNNNIYTEEFFGSIINVRDEITRPIAQVIYMLDPQGTPEKDWFWAQKILIELFKAKAALN